MRSSCNCQLAMMIVNDFAFAVIYRLRPTCVLSNLINSFHCQSRPIGYHMLTSIRCHRVFAVLIITFQSSRTVPACLFLQKLLQPLVDIHNVDLYVIIRFLWKRAITALGYVCHVQAGTIITCLNSVFGESFN